MIRRESETPHEGGDTGKPPALEDTALPARGKTIPGSGRESKRIVQMEVMKSEKAQTEMCSVQASIIKVKSGRYWIRTSDFHRVRMAL